MPTLAHTLRTPTLILCCLASLLHGCAGIIIGGAATGALIAHDRRTTGTIIDDQALALEGEHRVNGDPRMATGHINVSAYNGQVLLTGEVPQAAMRQQAETIVRSDPRVRRVFNELAIAAPSSFLARSSDVLLAGRVKANLFDVEIDGFDPTRVKIITERGIVYLMGLVTPEEGKAATEVVRRVGGVQKVVRLFEYVEIEQPRPAAANAR